jgi:hypothetical protein
MSYPREAILLHDRAPHRTGAALAFHVHVLGDMDGSDALLEYFRPCAHVRLALPEILPAEVEAVSWWWWW